MYPQLYSRRSFGRFAVNAVLSCFQHFLVIQLFLNKFQNYLLIAHPHGIYPFGLYSNFVTNANGVFEKFPGMNIRIATLKIQFWVPLRREWIIAHGGIDCGKASLNYVLDIEKATNNMVMLVVGKCFVLAAYYLVLYLVFGEVLGELSPVLLSLGLFVFG